MHLSRVQLNGNEMITNIDADSKVERQRSSK